MTLTHVVNITTALDLALLLYCPVVTNIRYSWGSNTGAIRTICVSVISRVNSTSNKPTHSYCMVKMPSTHNMIQIAVYGSTGVPISTVHVNSASNVPLYTVVRFNYYIIMQIIAALKTQLFECRLHWDDLHIRTINTLGAFSLWQCCKLAFDIIFLGNAQLVTDTKILESKAITTWTPCLDVSTATDIYNLIVWRAKTYAL